MKRGVLPDWKIEELIKCGAIRDADTDLVNTSSLDLRVGNDKWKLVGSFIPLPGQKIQDALVRGVVDDHTQKPDFYLECMRPYLVKLVESLQLPSSVSARIFNKSGRARIGVALKGLTDGTPHLDIVPNGYKGGLYSEISAETFPLYINSGKTAIPQIRFYEGYEGTPESMTGSDLEMLLNKYPILTDGNGDPAYNIRERETMIRSGKLTFHADLSSSGLLAYVANREGRNIDLSKRNHYLPEDFFNGIAPRNGSLRILTLHPGDFVLVKSKEHIRLPPRVAAEIDPYSIEFGDMKTSYANLVNSTHGWDTHDASCLVFEISVWGTPIILQDSQPLAKFSLYPMLEEPNARYMERKSTNFSDLKSILPVPFKKD